MDRRPWTEVSVWCLRNCVRVQQNRSWVICWRWIRWDIDARRAWVGNTDTEPISRYLQIPIPILQIILIMTKPTFWVIISVAHTLMTMCSYQTSTELLPWMQTSATVFLLRITLLRFFLSH